IASDNDSNNDSDDLTATNELKVSILMPARNEATNLPQTLPRILEQLRVDNVNVEVIVLNDHSTDGTAEILADLRERHPQLQVLQGTALPPGWNGKNWACQQLAEAATGQTLVFTDADVRWHPQTLAALVAFRRQHRAEFVSVWPRQRTEGWLEHLTVPIVDMILLGWLPYLGVRYLPFASLSAGNGQLMMWTRDGYRRTGGHAAVRSEVLEDVKMGQRAKGVGLRVALALGGPLLSTRMYHHDADILEGFGKNILAAHLHSRPFLVLSMLMNTLTYTLSCAALRSAQPWLVPCRLGSLGNRLLTAESRRSWREFPLQALMAYPLWRIGVRALRQKQGYVWKGRTYP
ncbi:MAG: glycosyltransferase, partial [Trueperaceae bacterium]|nr:glycosyltransferase [Trueperaceae bacterium]